MICNCKQIQRVSGSVEQQSMQVIWGSNVVADHKGPFMFLRGCLVHNLSLGLK